jgi:hypothetical protein
MDTTRTRTKTQEKLQVEAQDQRTNDSPATTPSRPPRWIRRGAAAFGLGALIVAGSNLGGIGSAPKAEAAQGCTYAPWGYVCTNVRADGTRISGVAVARGSADGSIICNYAAEVKVAPPKGKSYSLGGRKKYSGCTPLRAYLSWNVNKTFKSGTRLCGYWYEGNRQIAGASCLTVKG